MSRFILLMVALITPAVASATTILTSIKPIQMIVTELTQGVATTEVLLGANASPHDYALRPSDMIKIKRADIVVWFGPTLEPFLDRMLASEDNVITISELPDISFRDFGNNHIDDGHGHGTLDPHFWLGVPTVREVARELTDKFIALDPHNQDQYKANLVTFIDKLNMTDLDIDLMMRGLRKKGYYVFHDAYGYFEEHYHLNQLGHFTVSPERKPGAKTLVSIRRALSAGNVKCVFSEPQFTPAVIDSVTRGIRVSRGVLDPLGNNIDVKPGSYYQFLHGIGAEFKRCLSK